MCHQDSQENGFVVPGLCAMTHIFKATEDRTDKLNFMKKIIHGETYLIQSQKTSNKLGKDIGTGSTI